MLRFFLEILCWVTVASLKLSVRNVGYATTEVIKMLISLVGCHVKNCWSNELGHAPLCHLFGTPWPCRSFGEAGGSLRKPMLIE